MGRLRRPRNGRTDRLTAAAPRGRMAASPEPAPDHDGISTARFHCVHPHPRKERPCASHTSALHRSPRSRAWWRGPSDTVGPLGPQERGVVVRHARARARLNRFARLRTRSLPLPAIAAQPHPPFSRSRKRHFAVSRVQATSGASRVAPHRRSRPHLSLIAEPSPPPPGATPPAGIQEQEPSMSKILVISRSMRPFATDVGTERAVAPSGGFPLASNQDHLGRHRRYRPG